MIDIKRIIPECNADTLLVELILQRGKPAHYKGINKVGKRLEKHNDTSLFIVGLVDTDKFKREDPYIKLFTQIVEDKIAEFGIGVYKLPDTNKHLIRIHPEFEPWIWKCSGSCYVSPSTYGFNSLDDLYRATKKNEIRENLKLKKFINSVVMKNPEEIILIRKWLNMA